MLIRGTMCPLSKGEKNGNLSTILQSSLSMNVTALFICVLLSEMGIAKSKSKDRDAEDCSSQKPQVSGFTELKKKKEK